MTGQLSAVAALRNRRAAFGQLLTFAKYGALLRFARSRRSRVPPGFKGAGRPFEIPAFSATPRYLATAQPRG